MEILLLPANNAYVLLFGSAIIDVQGKRFWERRKDLLSALGYKTMREFKESQQEKK